MADQQTNATGSPLKIAVNPQTGQTAVLDGGAWKIAEQVAQNAAGQKAYLSGGRWLIDQAQSARTPQPQKDPGLLERVHRVARDESTGQLLGDYFDAGLSLTSSAAAPVAAGIAGIGQGVTNVARRALGAPVETSAADRTAQVEQALTHAPKTVGSTAYVDTVTAPLRAIAGAANWAGEKTTDVATRMGASPEVAGAAGATVNTGIQLAPSLIEPGLRAARAGVAPAATAADSGAASAASATARAQDYVQSRLGLDWGSLSQRFKDTLSSIATDAKRLDSLPVEAVKRQAQLQSLRTPVTTTAAKLTRDATALRNEANVSATAAGKPIRDIDIETNRQLRANVEGLRQSVGGQGASRATGGDEGTAFASEEVGRNVQGPLRAKEQLSRQNYNNLYKAARETDPEATTSTQAIQDLAKKNPAIQHLAWVPSWFKRASAAEGVEAIDHVKLGDLQDLREQAVGIARAGGTDGYHAGQVVKAIDQAMEEAPNAASAWKAAQKAFREHKQEFAETGAVQRLVADKSRSDRRVPLERTWEKSVQKAPLQEIRDLKKSLLSGGDEATRAAGKKALRELKQETVNQFLQYVTRKTATNEAGETQITAVQMVEGLKHIGGEARVREVLGNRAANELRRIIDAAKVTKTEPSIRSVGSSTTQSLLAFAEKWVDKLPSSAGKFVGGAARTVRELGEKGEADRIARAAARQPTDEAALGVGRDAERLRTREERARAMRRLAPAAAAWTSASADRSRRNTLADLYGSESP